ncbi:MAG TPA: ABC transporter substrate-binding protein [Micropepsaceae bacterium]|nr:ABC transporter substrate-binding protein [Micropepsaceae bacterium]
MKITKRLAVTFGLVLSLAAGAASAAPAPGPLKIGYSDWPGFVAWQVAIDKGWLKQAGINVAFEWFDYSASLDAFSAGKLDAVLATNGDTLVMGSGGGKGVMVMLTDYSSGNDMVVAKPGIKSLKDLKGQKVAVEMGLVDHLLLVNGLEKAGMSEKDVTLVNSKTNETPQVLGSGQVAAIAAWQPSSGQAMKNLPGSTPIYTSAQAPGLIYDVLTVSPASLAAHKADWVKLIKVWDRAVHYINDPKTQDDAVKIMSARDGLSPAAYKAFLAGTHLLDLADGKKAFAKGPGLDSIYGSTANADKFNVKNAVYKKAEAVDPYIDPSLTTAALQ